MIWVPIFSISQLFYSQCCLYICFVGLSRVTMCKYSWKGCTITGILATVPSAICARLRHFMCSPTMWNPSCRWSAARISSSSWRLHASRTASASLPKIDSQISRLGLPVAAQQGFCKAMTGQVGSLFSPTNHRGLLSSDSAIALVGVCSHSQSIVK